MTTIKKSTQSGPTTHPNTELQAKCDEIREALCTAETRDATQRYKVGVLVNDVMSQEERYGTGAVEQIATTVGCTAANLYSHAGVVRCWPTAGKFDEISKLRTEKRKMRLTFTHFAVLATVKADDDRENLLQTCLKNDYSVRELKADIAKTAPKNEKVNNVRALHKRRAAGRLVTASTSWVKRLEEGLAPLAETSLAMTPEQLELLLANCAKVREMMNAAEAHVSKRLAAARAPAAKAAE